MKKIMYLALLIVRTLSLSMPVMAKNDKCGKTGCSREKIQMEQFTVISMLYSM